MSVESFAKLCRVAFAGIFIAIASIILVGIGYVVVDHYASRPPKLRISVDGGPLEPLPMTEEEWNGFLLKNPSSHTAEKVEVQ